MSGINSSKKACMSDSLMKTILTTFFNIKGIVHFDFIPQGHIVYQVYYVEILMQLHEAVCRQRTNDWILHHNNVHKVFSVKQFLAQKSIIEMEHLLCSHDLALNEFWLFPKIKSVLKG